MKNINSKLKMIASKLLSDKAYINIKYFRYYKKFLNLKKPKVFGEKI